MVRAKRVLGVALALSLVLAVPAMAGPRNGETGKRDVIGDAREICTNVTGESHIWLKDACNLRAQTFSVELEEPLNPYGEFGGVTYGGKNPAQQETAMVRQASSAVLSIDDVVTRFQDEQKDMAAFYLCTYDQKARELGDRFDDGVYNLAQDAVDLATQLVSKERAVELGCLVP